MQHWCHQETVLLVLGSSDNFIWGIALDFVWLHYPNTCWFVPTSLASIHIQNIYSPGSKVISSYGRTCWISSEDCAPTWSAVLSMIPVSHQVFHTDRIHPVASRKWDLPHGDPPAEAKMCFFACISVQQIDWSNMTKRGNISLIRNYIVCIWWSCGNKSLISACFVCQISVISPQAYPWLKAVVFHQYVKL